MIKRSRFFLYSITLSLFIIGSCTLNKSSSLNLDFEQINSQTNNPSAWVLDDNPSYRITLDPSVRKEGSNALKIENTEGHTSKRMMSSATMVIDNIQATKSIEISGYIKTENTQTDSSGLFIATEGMRNSVFLKNDSLIGTHDWKEYTAKLLLKGETNKIFIGAILFGEGKIWFDDLTLKIDGKRVSRISSTDFSASRKELNWLKNHCVELKTIQPENGFEDLEPLKKAIGNARIIALGENTHGSSEVFKMKHRLIEFLATEMDFSIFSIEANMPEAYKLNEYVLHGSGDPSELLKGLYFWTWNTREVYNMIIWMRIFNQSEIGKIEFTGFDMQFCNVAIENIREFAFNNDGILKAKIDSISVLCEKSRNEVGYISDIKDPHLLHSHCKIVQNHLQSNKSAILSTIDLVQYNWLVQNANILVQYSNPLRSVDYAYRDSCMAENIEWILDNNPNKKIVIWAHDGHIARKNGTMGGYLSERYGTDYYNIGFLSNSGTYTANKSGSLISKNVMQEGKPGSYEYSFHRTGMPYFFFDFDQVNDNEQACNWLTKKLYSRSIGANVVENMEFQSSNLSKEFNAVIYIDETSATHCYSINY